MNRRTAVEISAFGHGVRVLSLPPPKSGGLIGGQFLLQIGLNLISTIYYLHNLGNVIKILRASFATSNMVVTITPANEGHCKDSMKSEVRDWYIVCDKCKPFLLLLILAKLSFKKANRKVLKRSRVTECPWEALLDFLFAISDIVLP